MICGYIIDENNRRFKVDLVDELPIIASYSFTDYLNKNVAIRSDKVESFELLGTKATNIALDHTYRVNHYSPDFVKNQYLFELELDGKPFLGRSIMTIEKIISNQKADTVKYNCSLFGTNYLWTTIFANKSVCELDLGTHFFNTTVVQDSWDRFNRQGGGVHNHEQGYAYVPVHYGQWGPSDLGPYDIEHDDLRPSVYLWKIVTEAFNQCTGYTLESKWMDSEIAQGLIMPFVGSDRGDTSTGTWIISNDAIRLSNFSAHDNIERTIVTGIAPTDIIYGVETSDVGLNYDENIGYYTTPFTKPYTFYFDFQFNGTLNSNVSFSFEAVDVGTGTGVAFGTVTRNAGTYTDEVIQIELPAVCIDRDTEIKFRVGTTSLGGPVSSITTTFNKQGEHNYISEINTSNTNICPNQEIDLASTIPCDLKIKDVIDGLTQMFNLKFRTDVINEIVYMEPEPEFLKCSEPKNFSPKVDRDRDITQEFLYTRLGSPVKFGYKEDAKDFFLDDFNSTLEGGLYGDIRSTEFSLGESLKENEISNPTFSAPWFIEDYEVATNLAYPPIWIRMWESEDLDPLAGTTIDVLDKSSYNFNYRIAYYGGLQSYQNQLGGQIVGFEFEGANLPYFPHAWVVNTYDPSQVSLSFGSSQQGTDVGLTQNYWSQYIDAYYKGRLVTLGMVLSQQDVQTLLTEQIFISNELIGSSYFQLNRIKEHNPQTGKAIVELVTVQ